MSSSMPVQQPSCENNVIGSMLPLTYPICHQYQWLHTYIRLSLLHGQVFDFYPYQNQQKASFIHWDSTVICKHTHTAKKYTSSSLCMPKSNFVTTLIHLKTPTKRYLSMAWYCSGSTNTELVDNLFKVGLVKNEQVKNAMVGVSLPPIWNAMPHLEQSQGHMKIPTRNWHMGSRLTGLIMPHQDPTQTRRNPSATVRQSQPRTCMATHVSTS